MERRPSLFANTVILLFALSCIVFRTAAGCFVLWLTKLTCQQLQQLGLLPPLEAIPRTLQRSAIAATSQPGIGTCIGICTGGVSWKVFERLLFHPLSRFPGPKLAAFTSNYEFYYDVILGGQYTFLLKALHDKYGPIIRISPSELHVIDPDFREQLFTGALNPMDKYVFSSRAVGDLDSIFAVTNHEKHRQKRAPVNGLFSKRSVAEMTAIILDRVEILCRRMSELKGSKTPLSTKHAYSSLTMDVITGYAFGKSQRALESPDFESVMVDGFDKASEGLWLMEFFPFIATLMRQMPPSWGWLLGPGIEALMKIRTYLEGRVEEVKAERPEEVKLRTRTVFHEMLQNPDFPAEDRTTGSLVNHAQAIIGAGITTSSNHLCITSFHLLSNTRLLKRLKRELDEAILDPDILPPLATLQKLEFLTAVIAEGHRLSHGTVHRIARISPYNPIQYGDWVIPAGWPVGMSNLFSNMNENIFPSPHEFDPDRFLGDNGQKRKKYLVPFSKGTRRCLGENLATAELYLTLAAVFRRFDLELFETTQENFDIARDFIIPLPKKGTKGLRVLVK